jgi:hypothetical protein
MLISFDMRIRTPPNTNPNVDFAVGTLLYSGACMYNASRMGINPLVGAAIGAVTFITWKVWLLKAGDAFSSDFVGFQTAFLASGFFASLHISPIVADLLGSRLRLLDAAMLHSTSTGICVVGILCYAIIGELGRIYSAYFNN